MAIFDTLLPMLRAQFPELGFAVEPGEPPRVTVPAANPEVGDVVFQDDGDEITAFVGHFTHSHFSNYEDISADEKAKAISQDVVHFLQELFADRIVMWGSHRGMGGWHSVDSSSLVSVGRKNYVWSGPRNI